LARERPLYCVSIGLCCTLFSALELVQRRLQISLRVPLFFFLFHCALSLCSLFFLDAFLFSGSCIGLGSNLCWVMTKSRLNIVGQLGKIDLGNTSLRSHNDSVRLYPHDRRILVLFLVNRFEVVGQRD